MTRLMAEMEIQLTKHKAGYGKIMRDRVNECFSRCSPVEVKGRETVSGEGRMAGMN